MSDLTLYYYVFAIAATIFVFTDGRRLEEEGRGLGSPLGGAILCLLFLPLFLPWYLACRSSALREEPDGD